MIVEFKKCPTPQAYALPWPKKESSWRCIMWHRKICSSISSRSLMLEVAGVASRVRSRFSWIKHSDSSISQDSDFMLQQHGSFLMSRVVRCRFCCNQTTSVHPSISTKHHSRGAPRGKWILHMRVWAGTVNVLVKVFPVSSLSFNSEKIDHARRGLMTKWDLKLVTCTSHLLAIVLLDALTPTRGHLTNSGSHFVIRSRTGETSTTPLRSPKP